jgi:hypothetical protein
VGRFTPSLVVTVELFVIHLPLQDVLDVLLNFVEDVEGLTTHNTDVALSIPGDGGLGLALVEPEPERGEGAAHHSDGDSGSAGIHHNAACLRAR